MSGSRRNGYGTEMDASENVTGTHLTCSDADCGCELEVITPCPHGTTYTCACGHPFEPVSS
jgi:hypothetical protein